MGRGAERNPLEKESTRTGRPHQNKLGRKYLGSNYIVEKEFGEIEQRSRNRGTLGTYYQSITGISHVKPLPTSVQ